jgi:hypothetical protein
VGWGGVGWVGWLVGWLVGGDTATRRTGFVLARPTPAPAGPRVCRALSSSERTSPRGGAASPDCGCGCVPCRLSLPAAMSTHGTSPVWGRLTRCPGRKPPFWASKRPACPYQKVHTKPIHCGERQGRVTAPGGPGPARSPRRCHCRRRQGCARPLRSSGRCAPDLAGRPRRGGAGRSSKATVYTRAAGLWPRPVFNPRGDTCS